MPGGEGSSAFEEVTCLVFRVGSIATRDRLQNFYHDETIEQRFGAEHPDFPRFRIGSKNAVAIESGDQRNERISGTDLRNTIAPGDLSFAVFKNSRRGMI